MAREQGAPADQRGIFVYSERLPQDQPMLIQALTTVPGVGELTTTGSVSAFPQAPRYLVLDIFGYFAP